MATICSMEASVKGQNAPCQKILRPRQQSCELFRGIADKATGGIARPEDTGSHEKKLAVRCKNQ
ncbi:MAG: hypothetical protein HRF42_07960 [Candidatus Brocadia sp.]